MRFQLFHWGQNLILRHYQVYSGNSSLNMTTLTIWAVNKDIKSKRKHLVSLWKPFFASNCFFLLPKFRAIKLQKSAKFCLTF